MRHDFSLKAVNIRRQSLWFNLEKNKILKTHDDWDLLDRDGGEPLLWSLGVRCRGCVVSVGSEHHKAIQPLYFHQFDFL